MPKVSVILPFYNASHTLNDAIKSIANQSLEDFECFLIDNNSTDSGRAIALQWVTKDNRFKLLHEKRQGVVYASEKGSKACTSSLIARMDADDISMQNRLKKQYQFLQTHHETGAVGGLAEFGGDARKAAGIKRFVDWNNSIQKPEQIVMNQFTETPLINPTAMWRKAIATKFGGYRHGNFPEDYELWLRWLANGVKIAKIPDVVLKWNDSSIRLTRTDHRYSIDAFYRTKSYYLNLWLQKHNPHYPNVYIWGASRKLRKRAKILEHYGIRIKAFIDISLKRQIDAPLIHYQELPKPDSAYILVYMPHFDIKKEIEKLLVAQGFKAGINFLFAA